MKIKYVVTAAFIAASWTGFAQDSASGTVPEGYVALMRSDVRAKKVEILHQNLTLPDDQGQKFWPLQREYDNDLAKVGDQRMDVIRDYAKNWDSLSDSQAKDLGNRSLEFQKKRLELRKKYFDRISKEVNPIVAAKFFQIEVQLEDIIDLGIASQIPLVK